MAYQQSPYSELAWLTAALMGEAAPKDTAASMGALADVIMNRVNGTQAPSTAYGSTFTYAPNTVAGQISAYYGGSPQFSSFDRNQSAKEGGGSASANQALMTALTRGAAGFSGAALDKYNQARAVASTFLNQNDPNYGRYTGSSGGSDFFVANGYPTYLRSSGRYNFQTIGNSEFFKLKSNGSFTPWSDPGDHGIGSALPLPGSDGLGDGFNVGSALGVGNGVFNDGRINTGLYTNPGTDGFGSQANGGPGDALGGGDGSLLGQIQDPRVMGSIYLDPKSFAGRFAAGDALGAGNGNLGNPGGLFESGDPYKFSTGDALQSFYRNALQREADPQGLASWEGLIHPGGLTLGQALDQMAASPEAVARGASSGVDPRSYAIADAYAARLNRLPDQQGLSDWMAQLSKGASLDTVLSSISNSQEAHRADLTGFYQNVLNRAPDAGGLQYGLDQIAKGRSLQSVETSILNSPEAQALGISPSQYASAITPDIYAAITGVGTPTTPVGPGSLSGTIGPGPTTGTVPPGGTQGTVGPGPTQGTVGGTGTEIRPVGPDGYETSVVGAPEASQTVKDIYDTILARDPDTQGAVGYQGQIQRGISPSIVEAQVLASPEAKALPPERYQSLVQDYQEKYGLLPEEAQTLAPLAGDFAQVLNRPADSKTLDYWDQELKAGTPQSILEARVLTAPETQAVGAPALSKLVQDYQTQYALKPDEVTALGPLASEFSKVVGRPVDTPTLQYWDQQIDAGVPQSILEAQVLSAPETQAARTPGLSQAVQDFQNTYAFTPQQLASLGPTATQFQMATGRTVDPGTLHWWADQMQQGADPTQLNARILTSPEVMGRTGGQGSLYDTFQAQNGRSASDYLAALSDPTKFSGANVSGNVGPGTFSGTFNAQQYLAANPDVAASGMNAEDHYLRFGFGEGRALDTAGHRLSQNFDGTAYLAANRDVAMAGMDPLRHFLDFGAAEGRAAPAGNNPYQFSNFNVSQGLGPTGNGAFGLGGIGSTAPAPAQPALPQFAAGLNVSAGVPNGSFGLGGISTGGNGGAGISNPYGFSNANVAGALGATPQTFGSLYPVGDAPSSGGGDVSNPFGFSGANVGGYDPNAGGGEPAPSASVANTGSLGYNSHAGEMAYLAGQVGQNQQQIEAGRTPFANNPNNWNASFIDQANQRIAANTFTPTPASTANAQFGLINPITPAPAILAPPVMRQGLGVNPYGGFGLISSFRRGGATPMRGLDGVSQAVMRRAA